MNLNQTTLKTLGTLVSNVEKSSKGGPRHLICQRHLHWFEPPPMLSLAQPAERASERHNVTLQILIRKS